MGITREDVARLAGVSTATVSYVVNDGPRPVSPEARARVLRAIEELGYKPNRLARGLARRKTHAVALIVPDNANPFFGELAHHVEEAAFADGYNLILCNSNQNPERELSYFALLDEKRIDGILLISSGLNSDQLGSLLEREIPTVIIDREIPGAAVDTVLVDNVAIGRRATEHLLQHGHLSIACLAGPPDLAIAAQRVQGYRDALLARGLAPDENLIRGGDFTFEGGHTAAGALLRSGPRPSALFACNDEMAVGALHAARALGLEVPRELAVVGVDNTILATISVPRLTTVAQPIAEIGRLSVTTLLDRVRGRAPLVPRRIVLETSLVVRESCGCALGDLVPTQAVESSATRVTPQARSG